MTVLIADVETNVKIQSGNVEFRPECPYSVIQPHVFVQGKCGQLWEWDVYETLLLKIICSGPIICM